MVPLIRSYILKRTPWGHSADPAEHKGTVEILSAIFISYPTPISTRGGGVCPPYSDVPTNFHIVPPGLQ